MAKRKGKIEITGVEMGPSTESELFPHDPAPAPPPADAAAAPDAAPPADGVPAAPPGPAPDFEARLRAVEAIVIEQREVITRQALELLLAADNALELRESREKVERLKARAEAAKAASSDAKKAHEAAVDEHFALERDLNSGQARLPFRDEPEAVEVPKAEALESSGPAWPAAGGGTGSDESWRRVPLATLGIPEELPHSIVSILGEADLNTIGELSDYLDSSAMGRKLTDVAGIGPAKAERIEAALDAFWAKWAGWQAHKPEPAAPAAEVVESTGEYDLDVALRAGAGPELPGTVGAEHEDDEERHPWVTGADDLGPGDDDERSDDDEFDDPDDEATYEDEAAR